jgi:hypothetical protein
MQPSYLIGGHYVPITVRDREGTLFPTRRSGVCAIGAMGVCRCEAWPTAGAQTTELTRLYYTDKCPQDGWYGSGLDCSPCPPVRPPARPSSSCGTICARSAARAHSVGSRRFAAHADNCCVRCSTHGAPAARASFPTQGTGTGGKCAPPRLHCSGLRAGVRA